MADWLDAMKDTNSGKNSAHTLACLMAGLKALKLVVHSDASTAESWVSCSGWTKVEMKVARKASRKALNWVVTTAALTALRKVAPKVVQWVVARA
jgi:hypothetical protein